VVTCACKARHSTEGAMTSDDNPWHPKAQRHFAILESHDYGKFLIKITMSVISWNGSFRPVGKESTFPSYPIGHECMLSYHCMREGRDVSGRREQEKHVCTARRPPKQPTVRLYHLGLVHTCARSISCQLGIALSLTNWQTNKQTCWINILDCVHTLNPFQSK